MVVGLGSGGFLGELVAELHLSPAHHDRRDEPRPADIRARNRERVERGERDAQGRRALIPRPEDQGRVAHERDALRRAQVAGARHRQAAVGARRVSSSGRASWSDSRSRRRNTNRPPTMRAVRTRRYTRRSSLSRLTPRMAAASAVETSVGWRGTIAAGIGRDSGDGWVGTNAETPRLYAHPWREAESRGGRRERGRLAPEWERAGRPACLVVGACAPSCTATRFLARRDAGEFSGVSRRCQRLTRDFVATRVQYGVMACRERRWRGHRVLAYLSGAREPLARPRIPAHGGPQRSPSHHQRPATVKRGAACTARGMGRAVTRPWALPGDGSRRRSLPPRPRSGGRQYGLRVW